MTMPSFCRQIHRVAKKVHTCTECGGDILPLDVYEHTTGLWDGDILTFKTCSQCEQCRDEYIELTRGDRDTDDGDYSLGGLRDELMDLAQNHHDTVRRFKLYRMIGKMDKRKNG